MRDIVVLIFLCYGWFKSLKTPYIGVLVWSWISYMNPHRLAYGFAYDAPIALISGILLFIGVIFTKDKQKVPINSLTVVWFFFVIYMGLTTIFAFYPEAAWKDFSKVFKIQLVTFITIVLINNIKKLNHLIWVICLSIGYFSVKGGLFTILTGGGFRVYGPSASYIGENNALAVAILMTIPLMLYLHKVTYSLWIRKGLIFAVLTSFVCALGSQSRGAFLALLAVCGFFWIKSKHKLQIGILISVLGLGLFSFMPESWHNRMQTIETYNSDGSALGRINAWEYAYNAANNNTLGMGFNSWSPMTFAMYAPNPNDVHAAHSIYFSVLADHGWLGFIMFISIYLLAWRKLSSVIKLSENDVNMGDINFLGRMLKISFIAYLVGATFLSLAYFDLPWHMVSFVVLIERFYEISRETVEK
jgi:putative inorganic carbon (HCO3(-)) transporter